MRGDLKRHLKIHLRLIEKEQSQKLKEEAVIVDSMVISNKPENDTIKSNIIYAHAANGDIFNETSNLLNGGVTVSVTNNNIETTNVPLPRKRKPRATIKQKKNKLQENVQNSLSVFQLPSTVGSIQNSDNLVTSIPVVDINKILSKSGEKVDGVSVTGSDEQYQIFLLGA